MVFDLESLRLIWWALLAASMIGMVLCVGVTLGGAMLLPILAENNQDRQQLVSCIAPSALANLAWLIVLVMIVFGAWPIVYAVATASFYPLLFAVLLAVLLQPLVLCFLEASENPLWRQYGYRVLAWGALLSAALLGLLMGNVLKGIPYHLDSDMHIVFLGDFAGLFNLFSMLVAATCVALFAMHGALFLLLKSTDDLKPRIKATSLRAGLLFLVLFALTGLWVTHLEGYHVTSEILSNAVSNPLAKFVKRGDGLWLDNYEHVPALWAVPALAFIGVIAALWLTWRDKAYWAMIAGSLCVMTAALTFGVSMFPFLLPSNISLNSSLTIWDSSASQLTMQILLDVAIFMLPSMAIISRWLFSWRTDRRSASEDAA